MSHCIEDDEKQHRCFGCSGSQYMSLWRCLSHLVDRGQSAEPHVMYYWHENNILSICEQWDDSRVGAFQCEKYIIFIVCFFYEEVSNWEESGNICIPLMGNEIEVWATCGNETQICIATEWERQSKYTPAHFPSIESTWLVQKFEIFFPESRWLYASLTKLKKIVVSLNLNIE